MRVNDRVIREELRREAASVAVPDDLWDRISHELEQDCEQPVPAVRAYSHGGRRPVRRMIAVGAAAGIFWMLVLPAGLRMEQTSRPDSRPTSVRAASRPAEERPPWEASFDSPPPKRERSRDMGKAASDIRWPSQEIALLR